MKRGKLVQLVQPGLRVQLVPLVQPGLRVQLVPRVPLVPLVLQGLRVQLVRQELTHRRWKSETSRQLIPSLLLTRARFLSLAQTR